MSSPTDRTRLLPALLGVIAAAGCAAGGTPQDTYSTFGNNPTAPTTMSTGGTDGSDVGGSMGGGSGSGGGGQDGTGSDPDCVDEDGDDYGVGCAAGEDCDDDDPEINPGAHELCDEIDQNCDMMVDNGCDCPADNVSGNCNMPTDLGMLQPGESKMGVVGNVPQEDAIDWYTVSFPAASRPGMGTPTISFAINEADAFVFDVVTGQCAAAGATCLTGGTGGQAIGLTEWSFADNDPMCCTPPNDSMVPWPNQIWLRVYRTSAGASCGAYQLQLSR